VLGECNPRSGLVQGVRWIVPKDIDELPLRAEWMRLFVRASISNNEIVGQSTQ
jgi:hypothetical protein